MRRDFLGLNLVGRLPGPLVTRKRRYSPAKSYETLRTNEGLRIAEFLGVCSQPRSAASLMDMSRDTDRATER